MKNHLKLFILLILLGLLVRLVLAPIAWHPDVNNHIDWGIRFWQYGPSKFYSANVWNFTWPNQPPGTIYMFGLVEKIYEFMYSVLWWINTHISFFPSIIMTYFSTNGYPALLKLPSIISDLGIFICIFYIFKSNLIKVQNPTRLGLIAASFYYFNPVIIYNSAVWGQTDAVINFLALFSFITLYRKKLLLSLVMMFLCFYIKASLLIFIPFYFIALLAQKFEIKKIILSLFIVISLFLLVTLPFSSMKNPIDYLIHIYSDKVFKEQLQIITANAFNLWTIIAGIDQKPQSLLLGPLTYQLWGQILFAFSLISPVFFFIKKSSFKNLIYALLLVSFSSFMLLTNMHERYLFPLFPYFAISVVLIKKTKLMFWILTIINLLNLYNYWFTPKIDFIVSIFDWNGHLVTKFFSAIMLLIFIKMYITISRSVAEVKN